MEPKYISLAVASEKLKKISPEQLYRMGVAGQLRIYKQSPLNNITCDGYELFESLILDEEASNYKTVEGFTKDELDMLGNEERAAVLEEVDSECDVEYKGEDPEGMHYFNIDDDLLHIRRGDFQEIFDRLTLQKTESKYVSLGVVSRELNKSAKDLYRMGVADRFPIYKDLPYHEKCDDKQERVEQLCLDGTAFKDKDNEVYKDSAPGSMYFFNLYGDLLLIRKEDLRAMMDLLPPSSDAEKSTEDKEQKEKKDTPTNKGGRPKGTLTQAVEILCHECLEVGNTSVLGEGCENDFIKLLQRSKNPKDPNYNPEIDERIESVKKYNGEWKIKTQEREKAQERNKGNTVKYEKSMTYKGAQIRSRIKKIIKSLKEESFKTP